MWGITAVTNFKKFPVLIYWNDIEIHLGFQHSYLVPPGPHPPFAPFPYLRIQMSPRIASPRKVIVTLVALVLTFI